MQRAASNRGDPIGGLLGILPDAVILPEMIHIRSVEGDTGRLARLVDLIMEECAANRPGRDPILERFLEVMLVECMRWPGIARDSLPAGLLAGMRDPALARALRTMHSDIRAGWTVAELGKMAGMSRSAFAARFSETLGCAPMEYLSRWRITLAQDALSRGGVPLRRLAAHIGYESASAFSTAFRRRIGCSPGAFARSLRARAEARVACFIRQRSRPSPLCRQRLVFSRPTHLALELPEKGVAQPPNPHLAA
jgi:AraC-like DNA-binding protein